MSDAVIKIGGDLSDLKHEFALATQFANQRVKEMAQEAKRHTSAATTAASSSFASMRGVAERSASIMGGAFGDLGDIVFDLGERATSAGGAIGGIGVTAGAAVVGVAALGYAAFQLAGYADEAAKRLEEAGLAAMIPKDAQDSLDRYRDGTKALRDEADLLTVSLSGDLLDAVGDLSFALTGALDKLGKLKDAASEKIGDTGGGSTFRRVLLAVGTGLGSEVAGLVSGAIETQIADGEKLNEIRTTEAQLVKDGTAYAEREASAREAVNQTITDGLEETRKLNDERRKQAEADRAAEKAQREAAAQFIADLRAQGKEWKALGEAIGEAAEQRKIWDDAMAGVADLGPAAAPLANMDFSGAAGAISGGAGGIVGGALKGISAAGGDGVMVALATTGPVGAAIATLVSLPGIFDGLLDTVSDLVGTFTELPSEIGRTLTETIPGILGGLGDLVTSIVGAALDLPGILMDAVPELVSSIVQLVPNLIGDLVTMFAEKLPQMFVQAIEFLLSGGLYGAIARGVWDGLNEVFNDFPQKIADKLGEMLSKVLNPFKDKEGDFLGTNLTAEGGRRIAGWDLPSFDRGTSEITRTGIARVHRGEEIRRKGEGPSRGAAPVINVYGPDTREIVRQIRELLGGDHGAGYGLGDALP